MNNINIIFFREEKRGLDWVGELLDCPSMFTLNSKKELYAEGIWSPLVRDISFSRIFCMTTTKPSPSGFQQKVCS